MDHRSPTSALHGYRYQYKGIGWVNWQSDLPSTGVVSPPTIATSVSAAPTIGFPWGPRFYLHSFYVTPYCLHYIEFNMTGYLKVRCCCFRGSAARRSALLGM